DFQIRQARQFVEQIDLRRDHMAGQSARQHCLEVSWQQLTNLRPEDNIGDERNRHPGFIAANQRETIADLRQRGQRSLDLSRLDSMTVQLDLLIFPSNKLDETISPPAPAVSSIEYPRP